MAASSPEESIAAPPPVVPVPASSPEALLQRKQVRFGQEIVTKRTPRLSISRYDFYGCTLGWIVPTDVIEACEAGRLTVRTH